MAYVMQLPGVFEQVRTVAWLRWRTLRNGLRNKNRRLDLIGAIFFAILAAVLAIGGAIGIYAGTHALLARGNAKYLGFLFLGLMIWWQLFPFLLAGFTAQFTFRSLLRFPTSLRAFYILGIAYGFADFAASAAVFWLCAMVAATLTAAPLAAPAMVVSCVLFALLNVTLERLTGAWLERVLSTRRSREIFFGVFLLSMMCLQFLNPILQRHGKEFKAFFVRLWPYVWVLPSSYAGDAVAAGADGQWFTMLRKFLGLCVYLAIPTFFLWQRYKQLYGGEELSETAAAQRAKQRAKDDSRKVELLGFLRPPVRAVLYKELTYLRRNTMLLLSLAVPPIMVIYFSLMFAGATPTALKHGVAPEMFFPGMMAYLVLITLAGSYNVFSFESKGIQTYFAAPIEFRDVLLAKNLLTVALIVLEIMMCSVVLAWRAGRPPIPSLAATLAAVAFSIVGQLTIANWSSLSFPRKMEFGKMQGQRNSGMSVLVMFGVQLLFMGTSAVILMAGGWTGNPWLPAEVFLVLTAAAGGGYFAALKAFSDLAEKKKEVLMDALCR